MTLEEYRNSAAIRELCKRNGQAKRIVRDLNWFMAKVLKVESGCWEWQGVLQLGYGFFQIVRSVDGRKQITNWKAHRYSWLLHYGELPDKLFVCHHCDNKKCVRPDHLFLGTLQDNVQDAVDKGLVKKGEQRHDATMTNEKVITIKTMLKNGMRLSVISRECHVPYHAVENIKYGRAWNWLTV